MFSRINKSMLNDIPADELKQLMDEIDATATAGLLQSSRGSRISLTTPLR
jgi:hypothetical protein